MIKMHKTVQDSSIYKVFGEVIAGFIFLWL